MDGVYLRSKKQCRIHALLAVAISLVQLSYEVVGFLNPRRMFFEVWMGEKEVLSLCRSRRLARSTNK